MAKISTKDIENAIMGVNFPAKKQEIIRKARENNAEPEVEKAIGKIPEKIYNSPAEVSSQTLNMENVI
jgi:hypothetical protein